VGSAIGLTGGWLFVKYINEIQDWLAAWFGFRVWDRDVFMFDKIPNHVDPAVAVVIALWAIASGLVGALIPGVRAAVMEPVEAIRSE
jgi:lipoprotein-releasing system permease protein